MLLARGLSLARHTRVHLFLQASPSRVHTLPWATNQPALLSARLFATDAVEVASADPLLDTGTAAAVATTAAAATREPEHQFVRSLTSPDMKDDSDTFTGNALRLLYYLDRPSRVKELREETCKEIRTALSECAKANISADTRIALANNLFTALTRYLSFLNEKPTLDDINFLLLNHTIACVPFEFDQLNVLPDTVVFDESFFILAFHHISVVGEWTLMEKVLALHASAPNSATDADVELRIQMLGYPFPANQMTRVILELVAAHNDVRYLQSYIKSCHDRIQLDECVAITNAVLATGNAHMIAILYEPLVSYRPFLTELPLLASTVHALADTEVNRDTIVDPRSNRIDFAEQLRTLVGPDASVAVQKLVSLGLGRAAQCSLFVTMCAEWSTPQRPIDPNALLQSFLSGLLKIYPDRDATAEARSAAVLRNVAAAVEAVDSVSKLVPDVGITNEVIHELALLHARAPNLLENTKLLLQEFPSTNYRVLGSIIQWCVYEKRYDDAVALLKSPPNVPERRIVYNPGRLFLYLHHALVRRTKHAARSLLFSRVDEAFCLDMVKIAFPDLRLSLYDCFVTHGQALLLAACMQLFPTDPGLAKAMLESLNFCRPVNGLAALKRLSSFNMLTPDHVMAFAKTALADRQKTLAEEAFQLLHNYQNISPNAHSVSETETAFQRLFAASKPSRGRSTQIEQWAAFQARKRSSDEITLSYLHDLVKETCWTDIQLKEVWDVFADKVKGMSPVLFDEQAETFCSDVLKKTSTFKFKLLQPVLTTLNQLKVTISTPLALSILERLLRFHAPEELPIFTIMEYVISAHENVYFEIRLLEKLFAVAMVHGQAEVVLRLLNGFVSKTSQPPTQAQCLAFMKYTSAIHQYKMTRGVLRLYYWPVHKPWIYKTPQLNERKQALYRAAQQRQEDQVVAEAYLRNMLKSTDREMKLVAIMDLLYLSHAVLMDNVNETAVGKYNCQFMPIRAHFVPLIVTVLRGNKCMELLLEVWLRLTDDASAYRPRMQALLLESAVELQDLSLVRKLMSIFDMLDLQLRKRVHTKSK